MIAMMSTSTGLVSGPGVKPNRFAPTPSTNIQVSSPMVAPMPSSVMITAFAGSTSEPNTRAMSTKVANTI